MPILCTFPQEYLAFNQTVSSFQCSNLGHFFFCQRIFCHTLQITYIIMYREWNRNLTSLMSPFQSDQCRMNTVCFSPKAPRGRR